MIFGVADELDSTASHFLVFCFFSFCFSKHILKVAENLTEGDTSDVEKTKQGLIRHVKEGHIFK